MVTLVLINIGILLIFLVRIFGLKMPINLSSIISSFFSIAWLYNESPVKDEVVVNDRWGSGAPCHQ